VVGSRGSVVIPAKRSAERESSSKLDLAIFGWIPARRAIALAGMTYRRCYFFFPTGFGTLAQ
jgi:hypothetical protein